VPAATSAWDQASAEATLWQLLNGARANNGLAPLQQHGTLMGLARWRSADMLAKDYFSHTIAGCGCLVYTYYDSNGLSYAWAGENIGWNSGLDDSYSPVRVHEAFMASAGHRANVLDGRFTHGGVGAAAADGQMFQGYVQNTRMYTELFMQARSTTTAPAPAPAPAPRPPSQPAPAPPPSGGGSTQPAPRPAAPAATATPEPEQMSVAAPTRPTSTAGLDGVATLVTAAVAPPADDALTAHVPVDERTASAAADKPVDHMTRGDMEIRAAAAPSAGVLEGIVGAIVGFLFG
jgi:hypothetical protein